MTEKHPTQDEPYDPLTINRFKIEAAMLDLIDQLQRQGLDKLEIALALADAAEDYVMRLASTTPDEPEDDIRPHGYQ
ncbi:hypothetical protein EDE05_1376 [Neorhizobium sp. R1-B]|jgi:hypothetical protein|uniref:hypothetical protein n=1 Tax=Neorhizobium TaxID=1525371 RepID=UPI000CF8F26E|nr:MULTISPECIES: hypothetical protein [Neorhizobium]TCV74704.1 hypothetical protein EDE09_102461 [Neorhizobium sp. S3-V5DH]TDX69630.1 hypothetical protein EDE05_1376 [Neorhizobium sp. R1-B]